MTELILILRTLERTDMPPTKARDVRSDPGLDKPSLLYDSIGKHAAEPLEIDHVAENKLVAKLDKFIIPIVMMLYLFSFLDRYA